MENTKTESEIKAGKPGQIIRIEQEQLTKHLDKVVRDTVEETLNALVDAEADRLCQAHRYERQKSGKTHERVIIKGAWQPKPGRSS